MQQQTDSDVLIVGAGPAGLSLAISLAQAGLRATVVEQQSAASLAHPAPDGREIALTHPSADTLRRLGSWAALAPQEIGRIHGAQVHDGPVGQHAALALDASGSGREALGWIVPNHALRRSAWAVASQLPGVRLITSAQVQRVAITPGHAALDYADTDGATHTLQAPLLVAAASRFSALVASSYLPFWIASL